MESEKTYCASLDRPNLISTVVVLAILVGTGILLVYLSYDAGWSTTIGAILLLAAAFELIIGASAVIYAPRGYAVTSTHIKALRLGPDTNIPLENIESVESVKLKRVIRTFGYGGMFGAWGWFWSKEIGNFRAYVTRRDRSVALRQRNGTPLVVSPDDPDGFMAHVRSHLPEID